MRLRPYLVSAIARRDFGAYFATPLGYLFIAIFVLLGSAAAFGTDEFFSRNMATLDTLNAWFPYLLLFFVPAVTMGVWAEERRQGTDELLLTLPATDFEIVLGKYLAVLGIYLTSLAFSVSHVVVLRWLGLPDGGLILANYLGYAMLGATLLSLGMVGSLLARGMTVAFLYGAFLCALFVFVGDPSPSSLSYTVAAKVLGVLGLEPTYVGALTPFRDLTAGVLSLNALITFLATCGGAVVVSLFILGARRHGASHPHLELRLISVAVAALALIPLGGRSTARLDLTTDRLWTLQPVTGETLSGLDAKRPVTVRCFVSKQVPRDYASTRTTLLALLREFEARSGGALILKLVETEADTPEALNARERYGIEATPIPTVEAGANTMHDVYLSAVFTCGPEEIVVPFFWRYIPVEYELVRSIRVVSRAARKKIGVLTTDAKVFGGFDMQTMNSSPGWPMVEELKRQYKVVEVGLDADYPADLDALVAVMPSTMTQPQLDRLKSYVKQGKAVLLADDPAPLFNLSLGPAQQKGGQRNMFGGGPPPEQKGDIEGFLSEIGVRWAKGDIVWDEYNPHPKLGDWPKEYVYVSPESRSSEAFTRSEPALAGLQIAMLLFPGHLEASGRQGVTFTPLMKSGGIAGINAESEVFRRDPFFGRVSLNPNRRHRSGGREYTLAARVTGEKLNLIVLADADLFAPVFFDLRRQRPEELKDLELDNVTATLNLIDALAGDTAFLELRKRKIRHRTLRRLEKVDAEFEEKAGAEVEKAENEAKAALDEAQADFDRSVEEIKKRQDLDEQAKDMMVRLKQETENRKLESKRGAVETEKSRKIREAQAVKRSNTARVYGTMRLGAMLLPLAPPLLLALAVWILRWKREGRTV